jgi:hypothetical protein
MKICKSCPNFFQDGPMIPLCQQPYFDIVDGRTRSFTCAEARMDLDKCGPGGRYYGKPSCYVERR